MDEGLRKESQKDNSGKALWDNYQQGHYWFYSFLALTFRKFREAQQVQCIFKDYRNSNITEQR